MANTLSELRQLIIPFVEVTRDLISRKKQQNRKLDEIFNQIDLSFVL